MSDSNDFLELMELEGYPPELEASVEEWINDLYRGSASMPGLKDRYVWLRGLFRKSVRDEEVEEMTNETLFRYLGPVKWALLAAAAGHYIPDEDTLMPAIRWVAQQLGRPVRAVARECIHEHKHEELLDRYFGIDQLTQKDIEEDWRLEQDMCEQLDPWELIRSRRPSPGAPVDPEKLVYESPKAAINRIADSVLKDYLRKTKRERDLRADWDLSLVKDEAFVADPEAQAYAQQVHRSYVAALGELPQLQRAAFILLRDPFALSDDEAEALLMPALTASEAKFVVGQRPMSIEEAKRLFGRDVSPDATKAAQKLRHFLSPLAPQNRYP